YLSWLALLGGPLVVGFGSLLLGARLADRIERRRMSLKRAVGILGLGAAGTLVGAWSLVFLLDSFERLVFSTTGIYAHEGAGAATPTIATVSGEMTCGSVRTSTQAARPAASARRSAGARSAGASTCSAWQPKPAAARS